MVTTFGWPNTLSPHASGTVIEDAWPTLFFGAERAPELRRKTARIPWARAALERWRAEAEAVLGPPDLPIEPIGWRHDFFAPASAEHLLFDPAAGESAVDPWDGTEYDTAGVRRRAWALLVHERTSACCAAWGCCTP